MKTKRYDFNYIPLNVSLALNVMGSVPAVQSYDGATAEYTPDYTITPLSIYPYVSQMDRGGTLVSGNVNSALANVAWYEIEGGVSKLIESTNTDYSITMSGAEAGRIDMKRNVKAGSSVTLEFHADYADPRNGQVYVLQASYLVRCTDESSASPVLVVDAATQTIYDPLRQSVSTQKVTAKLYVGAKEADGGTYKFVWEIYRPATGTWSEPGSDEVMDYDVALSADGTYITVDKSLTGDVLEMRCRAKYDAGGDPDSVELDASSPCVLFAFVRRIGNYDFDVFGVPLNVPADLSEICPVCRVWDANNSDIDFEDELAALWYVAPNKAGGTLSYTQVGYGKSPVLSTEKMTELYGGVYGIDLVDRGAIGAITDNTDGAVMVDAGGNIMVGH